MPASQLSQLKAALTTAGLDRRSPSKKDKRAFKKGGARETDRAKTLQRLEDIRRGLNKFDERETKVCTESSRENELSELQLKHDVGGRILKGFKGRPSASKQAGLEQVSKPMHQVTAF